MRGDIGLALTQRNVEFVTLKEMTSDEKDAIILNNFMEDLSLNFTFAKNILPV